MHSRCARASLGVHFAALCAVAASLSACGSTPAPKPPSAPNAPSEPAPSEPAASAAPDLPPELAKLDEECTGGSGEACWKLAVAFHEAEGVKRDEAMQAKYFRAACERGHAAGCYNVGAMMFLGQLGQPIDQPAAIPYFEKACKQRHPGACFNLGVIHLKGEGAPKNEVAGKAAMKAACALEHEQACGIVEELEGERAAAAAPASAQAAAPPSSGVPGATLTMGSLSADGLSAKDISCRIDGGGGGGGLFGALTGPAVIIGSLAKKKPQLDRCAPQGAEVRVRWSFSRGRVTKAEAVDAKPPMKACVEAVVKSAVSTMDGECAATLLLGKR
jgi:hypothetical protein